MRIPEPLYPVVYAAFRAATSFLSPVPAAVVLDPLPILLAGRPRDPELRDLRGLAYLPGMILGDALTGLGLGPILLRVLFVGLICLTPQTGGFHHKAWRWTFQLSLITAIGVDLRGVYPLGFVTLVSCLQGFLWWGLLAPRTGGGGLRPLGPLLAAPLALLVVHLILPTPPLYPFPFLGDYSSGWVRTFAILILVEPVLLWAFLHRDLWQAVLPRKRSPVLDESTP